MAKHRRQDQMSIELKVLAPTNRFLPQIQEFQKILWIGALSFEARCSHSLSEMFSDASPHSWKLVVLDYSTNVVPKDKGELKRETNWRRISQLRERVKG